MVNILLPEDVRIMKGHTSKCGGGPSTMKRLILIAAAALTIAAWAATALADGYAHVYTSGGRHYSRPHRTYYYGTHYYPRRTYYRTYRYYDYPRYYYRPTYRRVHYYYDPYPYYDFYYYAPPVRVYYYRY